MKLKQISLFLENKPGAINAPCKCLADAGYSISTLTLADTKFFGVLRLLIKDWEGAAKLLEANGFAVKLVDVVAIQVGHTAGGLAKVLDVFTEQGLDVEYLYAFPFGVDGKAVIIFRFDDPDAAIEKLKTIPDIAIVDSTSLFNA